MSKATRSLSQSIFGLKCPRCREGDLFSSKSSFNYAKLTEMPTACPVCSQIYLPEPGFYYGAMFISYIICGFWFFGFVGICIFGFDLSVNTSFILLAVIVVILFGWIFRMARSIWIHINVKYDPSINRNS